MIQRILRVIGILLLLAGFLFFYAYLGNLNIIFLDKQIWILTAAASTILGILSVVFGFYTKKRTVTGASSFAEYLKEAGSFLNVDLNKCEIIHNKFYDIPDNEQFGSLAQNELNILDKPNKNTSTKRNKSQLVYRCKHNNGDDLIYVSQIIIANKAHLHSLLSSQKTIRIYLHPVNPHIYLFDLSFLLSKI